MIFVRAARLVISRAMAGDEPIAHEMIISVMLSIQHLQALASGRMHIALNMMNNLVRNQRCGYSANESSAL